MKFLAAALLMCACKAESKFVSGEKSEALALDYYVGRPISDFITSNGPPSSISFTSPRRYTWLQKPDSVYVRFNDGDYAFSEITGRTYHLYTSTGGTIMRWEMERQ